MYEEMTYENILQDMLNRVISDVDKREGSVIYDALAPCAFKLAESYFQLNNLIDLVSGDTAVGEYLDRIVADHGLERKAATYAVRKIETSGVISIGTRWSLGDTSYTVFSSIDATTYMATCDQIGAIGNQYEGVLENIDNVLGITATLTDIIEMGADEENDDNLRFRFYTRLQRPATSGNANNYILWALEVPGVGDAKVLPLWNGAGTVKVVIVDSDKMPATEQLTQDVYEYVENERPIGALVTVVSAVTKNITIKAKVSLSIGYTIQSIQSQFVSMLEEYRKEIAFKNTYISYAALSNLLFKVDGVADYSDLKLNDLTQNVPLGNTEIPLFQVELEVM